MYTNAERKKLQTTRDGPSTASRSGAAVRGNIPNSAMLSMLGGDRPSGSSIDELGERVRSRLPSVQQRPQAQIPQAENEADRLSAAVNAGTPETVKAVMGQRMGADFSGVRFHTGIAAAAKADAMGARAYTSGADVYFGSGGFDPSVAAHELVHTAQQGMVDSGVATMSTPVGGVQRIDWFGRKKRRAKRQEKDELRRRLSAEEREKEIQWKIARSNNDGPCAKTAAGMLGWGWGVDAPIQSEALWDMGTDVGEGFTKLQEHLQGQENEEDSRVMLLYRYGAGHPGLKMWENTTTAGVFHVMYADRDKDAQENPGFSIYGANNDTNLLSRLGVIEDENQANQSDAAAVPKVTKFKVGDKSPVAENEQPWERSIDTRYITRGQYERYAQDSPSRLRAKAVEAVDSDPKAQKRIAKGVQARFKGEWKNQKRQKALAKKEAERCRKAEKKEAERRRKAEKKEAERRRKEAKRK